MSVQQERWKSVPNYPEYECSTLGSVRRAGKSKCLQPFTTKRGYKQITVYNEDGRKVCYVHDLVLRAFIGPPPFKGYECRHWDGKAGNCQLINLRWSDKTSNLRDQRRHCTNRLGARGGNAKASVEIAVSMRQDREAGLSYRAIGSKYEMSPQQCEDICKHKYWNPEKWVRDLELAKADGREKSKDYRKLLREATHLLSEASHPKHTALNKALQPPK